MFVFQMRRKAENCGAVIMWLLCSLQITVILNSRCPFLLLNKLKRKNESIYFSNIIKLLIFILIKFRYSREYVYLSVVCGRVRLRTLCVYMCMCVCVICMQECMCF